MSNDIMSIQGVLISATDDSVIAAPDTHPDTDREEEVDKLMEVDTLADFYSERITFEWFKATNFGPHDMTSHVIPPALNHFEILLGAKLSQCTIDDLKRSVRAVEENQVSVQVTLEPYDETQVLRKLVIRSTGPVPTVTNWEFKDNTMKFSGAPLEGDQGQESLT